jgi:CheY-like chemotaxis protein
VNILPSNTEPSSSDTGAARAPDDPSAAATPEAQRLAALRRYDILDTPPEAVFDRLARQTADDFGAARAVVAFLDAERQWAKSCAGADRRQIDRARSFGHHVIQSAGPLVVEDAAADARFADLAVVAGASSIRFLAGVPLATPDGYRIGVLSVMDPAPRTTPARLGRERLPDRAAMVMEALEKRRRRRRRAGKQARAKPGPERPEAEKPSVPPSNERTGEKNDPALQAALDSFPDLVQPETGERADRTALASTSVTSEARKAVAAFRARAEEQGLSLKVELPEGDAVRAPLNAEAFRRALGNLLDNAVKFTEEGGTVGVRVEKETHAVRVRVADTGAGIGTEFREKLFDDFTQEDPDAPGDGLGLAIVKRLTQRMDGAVEVTSPEGRGTVVTLSFPRVAPTENEAAPDGQPERDGPAAPVAGEGAATEAASSRLPRLLLVEDNRNTRKLARHVLRSDYDVTCVTTAEEALAKTQQSAGGDDQTDAPLFDVLVLDINLGEGPSGTELLRSLRATTAYADVPAIAFTAYAMGGDEQRLREAGFEGYLPKPFSRDDLLEEVRAACPSSVGG